jgi:hypothetical protein
MILDDMPIALYIPPGMSAVLVQLLGQSGPVKLIRTPAPSIFSLLGPTALP